MKQISLCIQSQDSFKERPCVSVGDSAYSHPGCLAEARNNQNQIHVSRARNNRTFYYPSTQIKAINQKGRPQCYGDKHYLKDEKTWRSPDESAELEAINKKGKLLMNKIQTPDVTREEAWWQLVMIVYVQLYLAREVAENLANPWEKYLPTVQANSREKSPSQGTILGEKPIIFNGFRALLS